MPQIGHDPGLNRTISGCIGQVYSTFLTTGANDLTAAAMAALRRSRGLAQVLLRIQIELLFALRAAEVIRLPCVLGSPSGGGRFYVHAAHRIFDSGGVLHYHLSFFRFDKFLPRSLGRHRDFLNLHSKKVAVLIGPQIATNRQEVTNA